VNKIFANIKLHAELFCR